MVPRRVEVIESVAACARCVSATKTIVQAKRKPRGVTYRNTDGQALRTQSADAPIFVIVPDTGSVALGLTFCVTYRHFGDRYQPKQIAGSRRGLRVMRVFWAGLTERHVLSISLAVRCASHRFDVEASRLVGRWRRWELSCPMIVAMYAHLWKVLPDIALMV